IRGADIAAAHEEEYREKYKQKHAKDESVEDGNSTGGSTGAGETHIEDTVTEEITMAEVRKRLRDRGQPICLFGEDEQHIRARLLKLEIEQPDMKEGWKNELQSAMRDVDEELVKE
ncbi:unnamed protein product, partial [Strongylus vulgaris]